MSISYGDYCRGMHEITIGQACLLAYGFNPSLPELNFNLSPKDVHECEHLSEALKSNKRNRKYFAETPHEDTVFLDEFAAWCLHIGWDIPEELAAMAKVDAQTTPPATVEAGPATTPAVEVESDNDGVDPAADVEHSNDEALSALFDPVTVEVLERMFATNPDLSKGKWKKWGERAARNGLIEAREERGMFNPYKAAMWFLQKGVQGWDLARCHRTLANNLPARSLDNRSMLTGNLD